MRRHTTRKSQIKFREDGGGFLSVYIMPTYVSLKEGATTLDTISTTTSGDTWYEYYLKCDGADVEVWRREKGTTDSMVKILETSSATQLTTTVFTYATHNVENHLDDLVFLEADGDTWESEVSTYNAANELTTQVKDGVTNTFTYDQFGRMTSKTDGTYTADYTYNYGDKLTKVASRSYDDSG